MSTHSPEDFYGGPPYSGTVEHPPSIDEAPAVDLVAFAAEHETIIYDPDPARDPESERWLGVQHGQIISLPWP